jgi:hypothetical protein
MLDSAFELVSDSVSDSASDSAFDSTSDSAFDSAFDLGISLVVNSVVGEIVGVIGPAASSASLKVTFRLIRTALLTGSYSLNMVEVSYPNSHSFSDRGVILLSVLTCGLSAYAAHPKVLICL